MRPTVTRGPVVSYTAVSPLPVEDGRSVLCCAISQVTLGGRYPPSCSMEPGSSSADPNEDHGRGHQEVSKRETGIEPATPSLARRCSTAEPLALTAAPFLEHPFSLSYGVILQSSLAIVLSLTSGFSPCPCVSIFGTGRCVLC